MRDVSSGMQAALEAPLGTVGAWFLEGDFAAPSGPVRVWSGLGKKTWNGHEWHGGAGLLSVEVESENADGQAQGLRFTMPPVDPLATTGADLIQQALQAIPGRLVTLWKGALDPATGAVVADPFPLWSGRLDLPEVVEDDQQDGTRAVRVSVSAVEPWGAEDRSTRYRGTPASQLRWDPTDAGLADVLTWGDTPEDWGVLWFARVKES